MLVAHPNVGEGIRTCSILQLSVTDVFGYWAIPRKESSVHTTTNIGVCLSVIISQCE